MVASQTGSPGRIVEVEELVDLLQKCRQRKDKNYARCLHAYLVQHELKAHPLVGNHLVPTCAECGILPAAQSVFDRLPHRSEHSWSSLISGYTNNGELHHAFHLFHQMQDACVSPSTFTFLSLLRACGRLKDPVRGHGTHVEIIKQGMDSHRPIGNTIVDMYGKCGLIAEACHIFDKLPAHDSVSWNALIAGYAEQGFNEDVLSCFDRMYAEGICPDAVTFLCGFKVCGSVAAKEQGRLLYAEFMKRGLEKDFLVGTTLVDMYAKCGSFADACKLFNELPVRDVVPWTALLAGYADKGLGHEALSCFERMQREGVCPDATVFVCSLKACGSIGAIGRGHQLFAEIAKKGLEGNPFIGNTLIDMYIKCDSLEEARQIFDRLSMRDTVAWNALIAGYAEHGFGKEAIICFKQMQLQGVPAVVVTFACTLKACGIAGAVETGQEVHGQIIKLGLEKESRIGNTVVDMYAKCSSLAEARCVFEKLPAQDAVSWAALMGGYAEYGLDEEVLKCYERMQRDAVPVDAITFVHCLKSCGILGALEPGREIHAAIRRADLEKDPFVGNTLIDMYSRCGSFTEGLEVFYNLPVRDIISWNAVIKGYGESHEGGMAVHCFDNMQKEGVKPDSVTFTCLLVACSHASLVLEGQKYFKLMKEHYGIEPTLDHYTCMVDLLARSGHVSKAVRFMEAMKCPPSEEILRALLGACKVYGEVELGSRCFEKLVEVNQDDAAPYLLMEDLYASIGRWSDVHRIEEMRKHASAKKSQEMHLLVNQKLHEFDVGDNKREGISRIFHIPMR